MSTLLVIVPGTDYKHDRFGCTFALLHSETGEHLASYFCSSSNFAYDDLYRQGRKSEWIERFGELEVKFINETDIDEEELLRRNKGWYDSLTETPEIPVPKIEVTFAES